MNKKQNISIAHINVRSLLAGFGEFVQIVQEHNFTVIAVTETWLTRNIADNVISIPNYVFYRLDRGVGKGGGLGIYVSKNIKSEIINSVNTVPDNNLENIWIKLHLKNKILAVGNIYRPPHGNMNMAIDQLDQALSVILPVVDDIICVGDVNVNLLNLLNPLSRTFETYNFTQLISEPTRVTNTTASLLDPIFITNPSLVSQSNVINVDEISDHKLVCCNLTITVPKNINKLITFRDFKNFDHNVFLHDLTILPWHTLLHANDIDTKVEMLNTFILQTFDKHAPLRVIRVTKTKAPWLTEALKAMMRRRDEALRKYRVSGLQADWEFYKTLRNHTLSAIRQEKKAYINFINSENNTKQTWKVLSDLNIKQQSCAELPITLADPEEVNNYFVSVHKSNVNCQESIDYYNNHLKIHENFNFKLTTIEEVNNIIFQIKSNAYGRDNISIKMIKYCSPVIDKYLTHIINCCIETDYFPSNWKCAIVKPYPKVLNPESFGDLRPVSILPALSKIFEKIMHKQIFKYLCDSNILNNHQSGFRPEHSTASALAHVLDEILAGCDGNMVTAMVLLDYSKAFDTINHEVLYAQFKYYGFHFKAINLIKSYLSNRRQMVCIGNTYSSSLFLQNGVPQGSILGPLFFIIYTTEILNRIKVPFHAYADDLFLYYSFTTRDKLQAQHIIDDNLHTIYKLSLNHNLKLNPSKCKLLIFGSKNNLNVINTFKVNINNDTIPMVESAQVLGLTIDTTLKFSSHVSKIIQRSYCNLKLLYSNRYILNFKLRKSLSETLVLSHLNYCNFVFGTCLDKACLNRLQKIQNSCCRLIYGLRKYDHVSEKINDLHWLNINNSIKMNLLVFTHKVIHSSAPSYIHRKFIKRNELHPVNVRSNQLFNLPKFRTSLFKKSYTYNAITFYNNLPHSLKLASRYSFKKKLKLHLLNN